MTQRDDGAVGDMDGVLAWLDPAADRIDRWSERASYELFRLALYVTMPSLVVLVTLDVALRYLFNAPLQWGRDANGLLLLMTIFCALPHAWDRAYHIRMEVFYIRLSSARRRGVDVLSSVAGIIVFGLMAVQGARFVPFMIRTGETGEDLNLPLWPFMGFLSVCAFVMVARIFANPAGVEDELHHRIHEQRAERVAESAAPERDDRTPGDDLAS
ncbi:MAG: TRAP transporter small permease [Vicinamibacterales bacterium]|nr:TRAP transporter small permease [Vicinamibacterales bacterium]HJN42863.1 TRAP transporter small permease [Vicinamibacterales bacterium]